MYVSRSEKDTYEFARRLAQKLRGGEIITLAGELGAGKTVFVKGLCKGLNISQDVLSPTFTLMNEYEGRLKLYHYDAYRLSGADEAYFAGITDYLGSKDGVCVIEWASNIADAFSGRKTIDVKIRYAGENTREIEISDKQDKG